jgi:hypothetical protein
VAFLYLPVVAYIVIRESWKVVFNVIRESFKFVNVIRDGTPSYRPSYMYKVRKCIQITKYNVNKQYYEQRM